MPTLPKGFCICAKCHELKSRAARGLCFGCYIALRKSGELNLFALQKYGKEDESELPPREKWEFLGDEDALVEMTERVENLKDLQRRLSVANVNLSEDQKRRIRAANSSAEVQEICNETPASRTEQVAQTEAENPNVPRKPKYISVDGFLVPYDG
jgi:hypothetical protein